MPGKCRPSLMKKTLNDVMRTKLSKTDKDCIKAVFERYSGLVRCEDCKWFYHDITTECFCEQWDDANTRPDGYCHMGERRNS